MNSGLKTQPDASAQEVLAGLVERVTYQNAENGFCVIRIKARGHRELVTAVGHAASIAAGKRQKLRQVRYGCAGAGGACGCTRPR